MPVEADLQVRLMTGPPNDRLKHAAGNRSRAFAGRPVPGNLQPPRAGHTKVAYDLVASFRGARRYEAFTEHRCHAGHRHRGTHDHVADVHGAAVGIPEFEDEAPLSLFERITRRK